MAEAGSEDLLDECTATKRNEIENGFVMDQKADTLTNNNSNRRGSNQSVIGSLKEQCLTKPPPNFRGRPRRSSSLVLDYIGKKLGGNFSNEPEDMLMEEESVDGPAHRCTLSPKTQQILQKCFQDIDPSEIVDYHVHLVGHGDQGSGCKIHESTKQWWRPLRRLKTAVFMFASQVPDMEGGDLQYISRLIRLIKHFVPLSILGSTTALEGHTPTRTTSLPASLSSLPFISRYGHGKYCLLAFDEFYTKKGEKCEDKTTFYVPNEYPVRLGVEFPEYFYPVGSVNPYRPDMEEELKKCADRGITIIKWLPNSMGIDPTDKECDNFYRKMKELDMALLIHVGEEHSVTAGFIDNKLGNPLFLRRPLSFGVKVIAAHCASEGYAVDIENNPVKSVPCFKLFMRLMNESQYEGLLYADISAICGFKRVGILNELLAAKHIHHRLVYGSDYPVPAINLVVHTYRLQRLGLITAEESAALKELYNFNPLLFDFASKRLLRGSNQESFPPSVFKEHPELPTHKEIGTPV